MEHARDVDPEEAVLARARDADPQADSRVREPARTRPGSPEDQPTSPKAASPNETSWRISDTDEDARFDVSHEAAVSLDRVKPVRAHPRLSVERNLVLGVEIPADEGPEPSHERPRARQNVPSGVRRDEGVLDAARRRVSMPERREREPA